MHATAPLAAIALTLLTACASGADRGASDSTTTGGTSDAPNAAPAGRAAASADVGPFVEACLATSNLGRPMCECAAGKARDQLSPDGFAFLTATLRKEEARATELRGRLAVSEVMAAGTFMVRGPAECAREGAGIPARGAGTPATP